MSSNIDQRIVEMEFKADQAINGIKSFISELSKLKDGLNNLHGSDNDINKIDDSAKKFSLHGMTQGISTLAEKFKSLGVVGVTALATIANKAVNVGLSLLKSLTIDPIRAGLDVYETKINAIQTILANTSQAGTTLKQVTQALNELNKYANLTVYNFGEMARNIGTFTAAGVGLKESVASIKGIANLAALSGASAEQASRGMYQLSQAIASGVVRLQDWNSVQNAGFGGKVFQKSLIDTARAFGINVDAEIKKFGSFRQSLQSGWLTSKVLVASLSQFTGDLTDAQIRALGFTKKQTEEIQKQAKLAVESATKIRTVTQLQQALREEVATAWSQVWEAIIGNIGTATKLLSSVHTTLENAFTNPIKDLAKFLEQWVKLGGRTDIIKAVGNVFRTLSQILHVVGQAFRDVFPPATGNTLVTISKAILAFTERLKLSSQGAKDLKATFEGVFSVFKIVIDVLKAVASGLGIVFGAAAGGGGSFLALTAKLGDFITKVRLAIESGGVLTDFFKGLGTILGYPIKLIVTLISHLGSLGSAFSKVSNIASPIVKKIGDAFSKIASAIGDGLRSGNFNAVVGLFNHLLLGGILLSIKKFVGQLTPGGVGGGLLKSVKDSFEQITGSLKTMQNSVKAGIIQKIAIAVGILAASLLVLSLINPKKLALSIGAVTALMTELIASLIAVGKFGVGAGLLKMGAVVLALEGMASAILILAGAVAIFAQFSWSQLIKGLTAVGVLLAELTITMALMGADSKGLIASAIAMTIMGVALNLLATAVARLGKLPLGNLQKGLTSIGILLLLITAFNTINPGSTIASALALAVIGVALDIIAGAVKKLGALDMATLAKGILGISLVMGVLSAALLAMEGSLPGAAALVVAAFAIDILSKVFVKFSALSWSGIAKSLVLLAGGLIIIAVAVTAMTGALPGAAALLVVAAALGVLTPILVTLSGLSWGSLLKALVGLAAVFVIIGLAGLVLTPLIPSLISLGVALILMGTGIALAGAGVFLFATGLGALAVAVTASGAAIYSFLGNILGLIPELAKELGLGVVAFATAIGDSGSAILDAFVKILDALLKGIGKIIPEAKIAFGKVMIAIIQTTDKYTDPAIKAFNKFVLKILDAGAKNAPKFADAGSKFIIALLKGIQNHIGDVVDAGTKVLIAFIKGIGDNSQKVVDAGFNMVIKLINGITNSINQNAPQVREAAIHLAGAIISGVTFGIFDGIPKVVAAATQMAASALNAALHFLGINSPSKEFEKVGLGTGEGLVVGIIGSINDVNNAVETVGKSMLSTLGRTLSKAGEVIDANMNLQPVITPVLDLSAAKKGFSDLTGLAKSQLISATASTSAARSISAVNLATAAAAGLNAASTNLNFTQNNTSPVALSEADIYRQTKNQLSIAKGVLAKNANRG